MIITSKEYSTVLDQDIDWKSYDCIELHDHIQGFDKKFNNAILDKIQKNLNNTDHNINALCGYILPDHIKHKYPNLSLNYYLDKKYQIMYSKFNDYNIHPEINYKNFICSFNGSAHVGRKLLVSILQKFGYFNSEYCSKNFSYSINTLDGHLGDYITDEIHFYRKFFISDDSEDFFQTLYSFGHQRFEHPKNIYNLESKLTESFLHIVSETMATGYYPYITEKFLYSIVTRGLFLTYGPPGWHEHIEKYYGFKKYSKLFDYRFDTIQNPVERLVELVTMVSKFKNLSFLDWHDLYLIEQDTIEYNYDHYFSEHYIKHLHQVCKE
jgi:hypothetical protein